MTRPLALIEKMGMGYDAEENEVEGPVEAPLGIVENDGNVTARTWGSP